MTSNQLCQLTQKLEEEIKSLRLGWVFGLKWVLANILGWSLGGLIAGAIGLNIFGATVSLVDKNYDVIIIAVVFLTAVGVGFFCFGSISGGIIGLMQWLVLRQYIPGIKRWLLTTITGGFMAVFVDLIEGVQVFLFLSKLTSLPSPIRGLMVMIILPSLVGGTGGIVIGSLQWLVLRSRVYHPDKGWWWIFANGLAGAIIIVSIVAKLTVSLNMMSWLLWLGVAVVSYGVITGLVLVKLFEHP